MKKTLYVGMAMLGLMSTASAAEFRPFLGLEGSYRNTNFKNEYYNDSDIFNTKKSNKPNVGFGGGVRMDINKFYVGSEAFINLGNLIDESMHYQDGGAYSYSEKVTVNSPFNLRFNAGYNFNEKFTLFGSLGFNYTKYESISTEFLMGNSSMAKYSKNQIVPSLGLGFSFFITKNIETRLSYEYMSFDVKDRALEYYNIEGKVDLKVSTFKLGLNYVF